MQTALTIAGWIATIAFIALIVVPWWRGRTHLVTPWTMFLAGSMNFIGLGMIQNAAGKREEEFLTEYQTFIAGVFVFYTVAALAYFWTTRSSAIARPPLIQWPNDTNASLFQLSWVLGLMGFGMGLLPYFGPGAQILFVINGPVGIAAFTLALIFMFRNPKNVVGWTLVAGTGFAALFSALGYGSGRRELLAVLFAIPVVAYWMRFRNMPKARAAVILTIGMLVMLIVISGYATIRHQTRNEIESGKARAITRIKMLPGAVWENLSDLTLFGKYDSVLDGQNAVWAGMLTIQQVRAPAGLTPQPFHTVLYIATNPIPRSLWPDKPMGLGRMLPAHVGQVRVTWGPSIIGHCFYDGGWPIILLYGAGVGWFMGVLDRMLCRDPDNPWQIAAFASVCGHMLGFARGDCGTFAVNILGGLFFVSLFIILLGKFFGPRLRGYVMTTPYQGSLR